MITTILSTILVVTNLGFTAAYDTTLNQPAWVAYDLEPSEVIAATRPSIPFHADPRIANSDHNLAYTHSGYDRGHLAPSADFNWSTNALTETYAFSNICPMSPRLNRGRWAENEAEVRNLALSSSSTVHIVIIPLFDRSSSTNRIGNVQIPTSFLKVAYGQFGAKVWKEDNN